MLFALSFGSIAGETISATVKNENTGEFTLSYPKGWKAIERHHINFATTFYRLVPPEKNFDFEMMINDKNTMRLGKLVDKDMERYIKFNLAGPAQQSVEKEVNPKRFGVRMDGVYALITDPNPKPGEYKYWVQGLRLIGNDVVLFNLYSNDKEIKNQILPVVDSVMFKKSNKRLWRQPLS